MSIGNNIKTYRKKANLTQSELSQLIGLSASAIRMYETDKRNASIDILKKMSSALKISIYDLIGDNNSEEALILENSDLNTKSSTSFTKRDYEIEFIRSHLVNIKEIVSLNDESNQLENIIKIENVPYTRDEFDDLMKELIEFLLFKNETKRKKIKGINYNYKSNTK